MRSLFFILVILFSSRLKAQSPFTQPLYPVDTVRDLVYGWDTTFEGSYIPLMYDLYRPTGDSNCRRPVAVVIHGGAWVAGTQRDPNVVYFAGELARRGWLAVCPQYRLGNHKTTNYTMYALCNASLASPCAYTYDSAEVIRANYRGMQDVKGLLRFLSLRTAQDSSDMNNLFLIGESAGGFIAMTTAFTDRTSEKPSLAGAIGAVPLPDPDMYSYQCVSANPDTSRPDLGDIRGRLAAQATDPLIRGVASIYGGVLDTSIFLQNGPSPRVFLFHQGSDIIIKYDYARLLSRISFECFAPTNYCQPIYNYPFAWGGEGIRRIFVSMGVQSPVYQAEIVSNYEYGNDCFDNGHSLDSPALRFDQVLQFFSQGIDTSSACSPSAVPQHDRPNALTVNYNGETIIIRWEGRPVQLQLILLDASGRLVTSVAARDNYAELDASGIAPGVYVLRIPESGISRKLLVE